MAEQHVERRRQPRRPVAVAAGAALAITAAVVVGVTTRGAERPESRATSTVPPAPPPWATVLLYDGSFAVGQGVGQVPPGTYTTTVPHNRHTCTWVLHGDGKSGNGRLNTGDTGRIEVATTDRQVRLDGGCTWKRAR